MVADPQGAGANLVFYHFLDDAVDADGVAALAPGTVTTRSGLPLQVDVVDGEVILNGTTRVIATNFTADNGIVHIVDMVLQPPSLNDQLALENIEFEVSSAVITPAGETVLQRAVEFFTANAGVNATIEGHTDTNGPTEANQELSQARAESVLAFLVANGLDAGRFTAVGFGETQPILLADGTEDFDSSRRIEFVAN